MGRKHTRSDDDDDECSRSNGDCAIWGVSANAKGHKRLETGETDRKGKRRVVGGGRFPRNTLFSDGKEAHAV